MPDKRSHRGPHPDDATLFTAPMQSVLAQAVNDMSWLLSRGYAEKSSLKLVGDRYNLALRQRVAVMRCACSDTQLEYRTTHQILPQEAAAQPLMLDGYNLLITVEAALAGGVLFIARDSCIRDLASIHGTYRKVAETLPALSVIADALKKMHIQNSVWLLDKPVSNSGRLKQLILRFAELHQLNWTVELVQNPDKTLIESSRIIATSDSIVLDQCERWLNLARIIVENLRSKSPLNILDLSE